MTMFTPSGLGFRSGIQSQTGRGKPPVRFQAPGARDLQGREDTYRCGWCGLRFRVFGEEDDFPIKGRRIFGV